jgi:L-seryl-tRNA(Ser) seleniumtransferase
VSGKEYFKELGVRTFINAAGTYTRLTGSLLLPKVMHAMMHASHDYVDFDELQSRVGERLANLLGCEDTVITSGAASAITFGTAGVLTGMDKNKVVQLPDLTGMKNEVILQKSHRIEFDHAIRACGVRLVEVVTRKELENAINENTAMLWFLNTQNYQGEIQDVEFVEIGKKYGIPTFNDAAADLPPVENLWKYTQMGFDMVAFSGGKGLRGPQSAGLLLGKKKYIQAARLSMPPHENTIGRGMKVNKEEIIGMMVAVEHYLQRDHQKEWQYWEQQVNLIGDAAKSVETVETDIIVPRIANHVPTLRIWWNRDKIDASADEIRNQLRTGHPSIETVGTPDMIEITTWMMSPGQERIVARRINEILKAYLR